MRRQLLSHWQRALLAWGSAGDRSDGVGGVESLPPQHQQSDRQQSPTPAEPSANERAIAMALNQSSSKLLVARSCDTIAH